mmetsp:Transcript_15687/g.36660  ORF Transcript_15687/g.36660 Transcript_15687/m.36660 type:complete len:247 (-) Transcript_15687:45-785(-)
MGLGETMLQAGMGFLGGYACRSSCASLPCKATLNAPGRSFKLGIMVHSATLNQVDKPGLFENQRPLVGITIGDRTKETEHGDWSKDKGHWCFSEMVTVVVNTSDEITVSVACSTKYNLYVASISLMSRRMGEFCFPVASILSQLKVEDRDAEGLTYTTPVVHFDVIQNGRCTGRVHLSFETKTTPPSHKILDAADQCCGWANASFELHFDDDEPAASVRSSPSFPLHARQNDVLAMRGVSRSCHHV